MPAPERDIPEQALFFKTSAKIALTNPYIANRKTDSLSPELFI